MTSCPVVVVGSINADLTAFADPVPRPGETVLGQSFSVLLGGKGSNQAVAAVRAGVPTWLIGCVGDDLFKDLTLGALAAEGIELGLVEVAGDRTGIAHIRVDAATGENDIVVVPLANAEVTPARVDRLLPQVGAERAVLMLQLEVPTDTVCRAAALGRELGWTVLLDPGPALALPESVWADVDVVTPNESEAGVYTGVVITDRESAAAAGRWFVERGVGRAVITRGEHGVVVVEPDTTWDLETRQVTAVDGTAAGDAFAGNLAAALAQGNDWRSAVRRGVEAGAYAVTVKGASPSMPFPADLSDMVTALTVAESDQSG